jgi:hypothetical protein
VRCEKKRSRRRKNKRFKNDEIIRVTDIFIDLLLQSNNATVKMKKKYTKLF